jgi:hypothetical protein
MAASERDFYRILGVPRTPARRRSSRRTAGLRVPTTRTSTMRRISEPASSPVAHLNLAVYLGRS